MPRSGNRRSVKAGRAGSKRRRAMTTRRGDGRANLPLVGRSKNAKLFSGGGKGRGSGPHPTCSRASTSPQGGGGTLSHPAQLHLAHGAAHLGVVGAHHQLAERTRREAVLADLADRRHLGGGAGEEAFREARELLRLDAALE